jgi:asparagine synthase (glutamine-hydrolysing)
MCGIAGKVDFADGAAIPAVEAMCARLARRGPDAQGVRAVGAATLGHRRLSIIDLSEAANQPMADRSGRYWTVFNGEIYNYRDVRDDLARAGASFGTNSDTEVVLEAFRRWGPACLDRLSGMFALAIWDAERESLFLARDRFGEKPLYYALSEHGIVFASQLDAVLEDARVVRRLDPEALAHYMAYGYTATSASIVAGVAKLPPATWATFGRDGFSGVRRYWDLRDHYGSARAPRSLDAAAEMLAAEIDRAAASQLVADVPVGAFLSGGIDSSSIVSSLARTLPPGEVATFSSGFDVEGFSELDEADLVARHLGVAHRSHVVGAGEAAAVAWADAWDEPFADTSMIPMWYLARFAGRHVRVALSGDAGDELFAGYETYAADGLRRLLQPLPRSVLDGASALVQALLPSRPGKVTLDFKIRQFLRYAGSDEADAHLGWRRLFSADEIAGLLRPAYASVASIDPNAQGRAIARECADMHWIDRMGYLDVRTWLPDDILVKVDRATMAHGLEARAPFLDHRLAEFAAGLPPEMKMSGGAKKRVLKRSQQGRLPERTLARRKAGFNAPVAIWLRTWREGGRLLDPHFLAGELFEPKPIASLCEDHFAGRRDNGHKLFALMNFALWRERFRV